MLLQVEHVDKSFGQQRALDDVSLVVPQGTVYGLLGPNGAGKTTLIRIINGITAPDSGSALLSGRCITLRDAAHIGYLPEERGLYKKMKVGEQVLYLARLKGLSRHDAELEMRQWFDRFDIGDWRDKKIEELSKGMAQKVQFVATVIHRPELLILDEPFSGFDPVNAEQIRQEVLRLNREGTTVILSTHNMESVETLCREISLINHGRIVLQGEVAAIREMYKTHLFRLLTRNALPEYTPLNTKGGVYEYVVQKESSQTNSQLLKQLAETAEIVAFEEILPRMNDIFIQTVCNQK
ncbi:MAG: ATP-binding cassette domain-containing protein [Paludibacter sp.]|nr:ATP-binding cassette domain-containing protein [Bacteroidales bacterium]MCM1068679.1 ATP-binding cassette domain-containing protein [Prevotella sp.]MCM1353343.1 ATP-binding cassette domain-containing protein [Bacteroides sp.]MCM1442249.1 ATP-binding cassette domain-containing protein [Muribaculum sp.]MCM1481068.1 ATP-binding cassette domain-containing protein [Paludibacter sp.]